MYSTVAVDLDPQTKCHYAFSSVMSFAVVGCVTISVLLALFLWGFGSFADDVADSARLALPFATGHAHNSENIGGLFPALQQGFCSIEADAFAADGKLLVGHNLDDLRDNRSLQALYLDPLAALVCDNGGWVYPQGQFLGVCKSPTLMIDVKEISGQSAEASYGMIHAVLEQYAAEHPGLLTSWQRDGGAVQRGAVKIMISGDRPSAAHMLSDAYPVRYAILDGRDADLDSGLPTALVPLISKAWRRDTNPLHPSHEQLAAARVFIQRAHAQGRDVRFWGTLDTPSQWQMLFDLGVDVISTDDLAGLRAFVAMRAATRRRSLFRWRMAPPLPSSLTVDVVVSRLLNRRGGNRGEGGNR